MQRDEGKKGIDTCKLWNMRYNIFLKRKLYDFCCTKEYTLKI